MDEVGEVSDARGRGSYWFGEEDSAVELLAALRDFQSSHGALRRRMSAEMAMNTTDLAALRHAIAHEGRDEPLTPLGLARLLRISGASTSKLLDRLTASGHLLRVPHPRDGRSSVVIATAHGHAEVRSRLGGMHERMLGAAREVPEGARREAAAFLRAMARVLDEESTQAAPLVVDEDPAPRGG
jgi:DNA-binding MarR family transcriptional regulator